MNESKPRTFRFRLLRPRFGLRTALVVVAILGVALGLFSRRWQHARRQALCRAEITRLGGGYRWDYDQENLDYFLGGQTLVPPESINDWGTRLLGIDFTHDVVGVYFSDYLIGLEPDPQVSDATIEQIVDALPELREVTLARQEVTDVALIHLARASKLERLDLYRTQITDAGLPELDPLSRLKCLNLGDTKVNIAGLNRCLQNSPLEVLYLSPDQLNDEANFRELMQQRPGLDVRELRLSGATRRFRGLIEFRKSSEVK